jgi:hypothetical protein
MKTMNLSAINNPNTKTYGGDMAETYQTSDIGLSAFLRARGHRIIRIYGTGGKSTFEFTNSKELSGDILAWVNNEPSNMPARGFFNSLRDLKGLATSR